MKPVYVLAITGLMTLSFQNCSNVDFESSSPASVAAKIEVPNQIDYTEETGDQEQVLEDVLALNPACDALASSTGAEDLLGKDKYFKGILGVKNIKNADHLYFSGISKKITVHDSFSVSLTGVHPIVCLRATHFEIMGVHGTKQIPSVLIGNGDSYIAKLTGASLSDLVLVDIKEIGDLKGVARDHYIYGGIVRNLHGGGRDIHLMNGAEIESLRGLYRNVYVYPGSKIHDAKGKFKLVTVK